MAPDTKKLTDMVELLTEQEQWLVYELISRLLPDDIATPEDIASHAAAVEEYRRGEVFRDDEIDWDAPPVQ